MVRLGLDKVQAIQAFVIPQTMTDVLASQGIIGKLFPTMPLYIALPLTDLTNKTPPNQVRWDSHCDAAFNKSKHYCAHHQFYKALTFDIDSYYRLMLLTEEWDPSRFEWNRISWSYNSRKHIVNSSLIEFGMA